MDINLIAFFTILMANLGKCWHSYNGLAPACQRNADCDKYGRHQTCMWLYEGCENGQCRCDPVRTIQLHNGQCVSLKMGDEFCSAADICIDGMNCQDGKCRCKTGSMTSDHSYCLGHREKLLGQSCRPSIDTCLQIDGSGYTRSRVGCSQLTQKCECMDGVQSGRHTCRSWRLHEKGCSKLYHCTGGAVCVDSQCICPSGYTGAAGGTKCVRREAIRELPVGSECDEINDESYCAQGLVCHRCSHDTKYHCVRFSMLHEMAMLTSGATRAIQSLHLLTVVLLYIVGLLTITSSFVKYTLFR